MDAGAVRGGGVDVRDLDTAAAMAQFAIVFQDVHLFGGTIEDNVRLGRPDATAAEVRAAAEAARLDEVIERLPGGRSAAVGEGGALLSGGERQRVSIARALLRNAPIVLLDEVTSALDPVNDAAVLEGIERLAAGRTVVMVAHRLNTVRRADRIVFLDKGGSWRREPTRNCCTGAVATRTSGRSPTGWRVDDRRRRAGLIGRADRRTPTLGHCDVGGEILDAHHLGVAVVDQFEPALPPGHRVHATFMARIAQRFEPAQIERLLTAGMRVRFDGCQALCTCQIRPAPHPCCEAARFFEVH